MILNFIMLKSTHLSKPTPCQYCGKNFKGKIGLMQHIKRCPSYNQAHCCTFCRSRVIDLTEHLVKCKDNPVNHDHICKFCGALRVQMELHLTKCNANPNKPINRDYICKFCGALRIQMELHLKKCFANPNNRNNLSATRIRSVLNSTPINQTNSTPINQNNSNSINSVSSTGDKPKCDSLGSRLESNCDLANVLALLAKRLKYDNTDDLLQDHDLLCSVCFEITDNKTKCNHPVCPKCLDRINKSCPICMADLQISLSALTLSPQ